LVWSQCHLFADTLWPLPPNSRPDLYNTSHLHYVQIWLAPFLHAVVLPHSVELHWDLWTTVCQTLQLRHSYPLQLTLTLTPTLALTLPPLHPLRHTEHTLNDRAVHRIVRNTAGYSAADLTALCKEAAIGPMREVCLLYSIFSVPLFSILLFCLLGSVCLWG
jgi:AAA+ lid domain-containing protein